MSSTYTSSLRLEIQADGENSNDWGDRANSVFQQIEQAVAGYTSITLSGATVTLTALNATTDQSRPAFLELVGTLTSNVGIIIPSVTKGYMIRNNTSGNFSVTVKCTAGTGLVVPQGGFMPVVCDSASVFQAVNRPASFEVAGSTSIGSVLNVAGAASLASTLTVNGAASVGSLNVTDKATTRTNLQLSNARIQKVYAILSTGVFVNATIPRDGTIPQSNEGTFVMQASIIPVSATNLLEITFDGQATQDSGASGRRSVMALFVNGNTNAIQYKVFNPLAIGKWYWQLNTVAIVSANGTSPVTVSVRAGVDSGDTVGYNDNVDFGDANYCILTIEERNP